jgi:hypothetical protein
MGRVIIADSAFADSPSLGPSADRFRALPEAGLACDLDISQVPAARGCDAAVFP